jgi:hypothetical protein
VLHDPHLGELQAVVPAQARPAILTLEEPGVEGRGEGRVAAEVADRPQPQSLGGGAPDGQRIRVVEAQRIADREAERMQPIAERGDRRHRRVFQDQAADRSRVLDVDVDVAAGQRAIHDARTAEAQSDRVRAPRRDDGGERRPGDHRGRQSAYRYH